MAYKTSGANSGTGTSVTVTLGAAPADNDIIVMLASMDYPDKTITFPAGFTSLAQGNITGPDGHNYAVAWKRAVSEGTTFACGGDTDGADYTVQVFTFDGRHTVDPPVIGTVTVNTSSNSSPVTVTAPAVTAVAGDDILWIGVADTSGHDIGGAFAAPTDYTERQDTMFGWNTVSGASRDNVSAGSTGSISGTLTLSSGTSGWASALIRIPAAAAAGDAVPVCWAQYRRRMAA